MATNIEVKGYNWLYADVCIGVRRAVNGYIVKMPSETHTSDEYICRTLEEVLTLIAEQAVRRNVGQEVKVTVELVE